MIIDIILKIVFFGDIFDIFQKKICITIRAQIRNDMLLLHEEMGQYAALGEEEKSVI